jgi:hypothetical protein
MLLEVMGSCSQLKRPWDESELHESENPLSSVSTSVTQSGRRFSADLSSPVTRRSPPMLATHERPQILRQHSWAAVEAGKAPTCKASPRPYIEGSNKRPCLFYDRKESTSAGRFDYESSTANSSVRTSPYIFRRKRARLLCCDLALTRCVSSPIAMNIFDGRQRLRPSTEWRTGVSPKTPYAGAARIQKSWFEKLFPVLLQHTSSTGRD